MAIMRLTCGKVRTAQTCAIVTVDPVTMKDFFAMFVKPKAAGKAAFTLWNPRSLTAWVTAQPTNLIGAILKTKLWEG